MKCIILAGGQGTRLRPLTNDTPKSLLMIAGKPALERTLEALPNEITGIVIAVKYLGFKVKQHFGKKFGKRSVAYVDLVSLRGTMDALKQCKKYIKGQTMVLYGDDIYSADDLAALVKQATQHPQAWHILLAQRQGNEQVARVIVEQSKVVDIIEAGDSKAIQEQSSVMNTGAYVIDERIFTYKPVKTPSGEYGLPQTMLQATKDLELLPVHASQWTPLNTLEDYKKANGSLF